MGFLTSKRGIEGKTAGKKGAVSIEEFARLKKWYSEELKRKDRIIDDLKTTNTLLMRTALRRSAEQQNLKNSMEELKKRVFERK